MNKPDSGSVTDSYDFHYNALKDGTILIMESTFGMLSIILCYSVAEFDQNDSLAVSGFAKGTTFYRIVEQTGADSSSPKELSK